MPLLAPFCVPLRMIDLSKSFFISHLILVRCLDPSPKIDESTLAPEKNADEEPPSQVEKSAAASGLSDEVAGVVDWCRPSGVAFGAATSLYERNPTTGETAGNPLADVTIIFH